MIDCPVCGGSGEDYHWSMPDLTDICYLCGGTGQVYPSQLEPAE